MHPVRCIRAVAGITQASLATAAGTSQPTVAAYESGSKSPTWRTIERLVDAVRLGCYVSVGEPLTRVDQRSLALHLAIAHELWTRTDQVVELARKNLDTMRSGAPHATALLDAWEAALGQPIEALVSQMLDPTEHGRAMRQVTPFAGVLTGPQRTVVYRLFRGAA